MNTALNILLIAALLAVVAILIAGFVAMARGGEVNRRYANKLMRWRVIAQGVAIVLFLLKLAASGAGQG